MNKADKKLAFAGLISNLLVKFIGPVISAAMVFLLVKFLSVEAYGKYNVYLSIISIITPLQPGITPVLKRYFPEYVHRKKMRAAIKLLSVLFAFRVFVLIVILGGGFLVSELTILSLDQFNFEFFHLAVIGSALVVSNHFFLVALNSAYLEHRYFNSVNLAMDILRLVAVLVLLQLNVLTMYNLISILILSELLIFILIGYRLFSRTGITIEKMTESFREALEYRRYWDFGKYIFYNIGGGRDLANSISNLFISYNINNLSVGLYAFASKIPFLAYRFSPTSLLANVITPLLTKKYVLENGNIDIFKNPITVFVKLSVVVWSVMVVFISINLRFLIGEFFTEEYLEAIPMINFWLVILYSDLIRVIYTRVAMITENTKIMLFLLLGTILNIVGNIILIPKYGMYGALYSTGFSLVVSSFLLTYQATKLIQTNLNKMFFFKLIFNISLSYLVVLELNKYCNDSWLNFFCLNAFGAVIVLTIFSLNRCFSKPERDFINNFLPRKLFIF